MANLYIMIGPAGCGKTTIAKQLAKSVNGVVVSSDQIRYEVYGDVMEQKDHEKIFEIAHERILENLNNGQSVIFDATNLQRKHREAVINLVKPVVNRVIGIVYDGDLASCIEQNQKRNRQVPEDVITRMYNTLHGKRNNPVLDEGFDYIYRLSYLSEFYKPVLNEDSQE